ncbi:Acyl-protein thioesterase [Apiospora arundinis]
MDYPEPLVVPPFLPPHQQTFIILHGRGSSGDAFGPPLLDTPLTPKRSSSPSSKLAAELTSTQSLVTAFPHALFVFPSAPRRRAALYKRTLTYQWFDNWDLAPPAIEREELQNPVLRETTLFLHQLLRTEIELVPGGAKHVVLGGLSQGCAASLVALLLWEGDPLGAFVGMSGWLPYAYRMNGLIQTENEKDEGVFDPFQRDEGEGDKSCDEVQSPERPIDEAVAWLREQIELGIDGPIGQNEIASEMTPVFLGHGVMDDKVNVDLGKMARDTLSKLELRVTWKEYKNLGHWYSNDMLRDLTNYLNSLSQAV